MATGYAPRVIDQKPAQNLFLGALREGTVARLSSHLKYVHLPGGEVLYEAGAQMHRVYFPTDSIISLLCVLQDGASAEVAVIGNEGVLGVPVLMGVESTSNRVVVRNAGGAYHLPCRILKEELQRCEELMALLLHYTQALITQMAQSTVCNRHHTIDQHLCRCLLMTLDRLAGDQVEMTQEWIATLLGVRREGITDAAGKLQRLGVITYRRGRIKVLDRAKLESLCCECYAVVNRETCRLLHYLPVNRQR